MREEDKKLAESLEKELQSLVQSLEEPDSDFENMNEEKPILDLEQPQIAADASEEAIDRAMDKIISDTIGNIPAYDDDDDDDEDEEEVPGNLRKAVIGTAIALGAVVLIGGGLYGWKAFSYKDRLFDNTIINKVDCSNLTVAEAEELMRNRLENYELTIQFRGEQSALITGEDIGYSYVSDGKIQQIKDEQNPLLWMKGWFSKSEYTVGENIKYDEEMLLAKLDSLSQLDTLQMISLRMHIWNSMKMHLRL